MCLCMHVSICWHTHVYICEYKWKAGLYINICVCILHICMWIYVCVCVYVCLDMYVDTARTVCVWCKDVFLRICLCVCLYM